MFVARVSGNLVSTQKVETMVGYKLLVVEPYRLDAEGRKSLTTTGRTFIAGDTLGAGVELSEALALVILALAFGQ